MVMEFFLFFRSRTHNIFLKFPLFGNVEIVTLGLDYEPLGTNQR